MRMRRFWTLAVVATIAGLGAGCTTATPAASGARHSRAPVVEVLPNGLTLIVRDHRARAALANSGTVTLPPALLPA